MYEMIKKAWISDDEIYRYALERTWDKNLRPIVFLGLNPSTADASINDPTIRRCMTFARGWGYGSLIMINLFAYRDSKPINLRIPADSIGPENDKYWEKYKDNRVIGCWGSNSWVPGFDMQVEKAKKLFKTIWCLGVTQAKCPKHPLYLKSDTKPIVWYSSKIKV